MRLTAHEVAQGLLHSEEVVRNGALRYFAKAFSRNPAAMPLAIQAVETCGWEAAFECSSYLSSLVQTEETFRWLIDRMESIGYPATPQAKEECLGLAAVSVSSDAGLLAGNRQRVNALKGLHPQHRHVIADRLRLLARDAKTCWNDLEAWCQRNRRDGEHGPYGDPRWVRVDVPAAQRLVEAIARDGQSCAERVLDILSQEIEDYHDSPMAWMECFAAQAAGELHLEAAAPLLAAKLRKDGGDLLNEECMYSLAKIGTDAAAAALCDNWPAEPEHFKLYGISSLESIHADAKVRRCLTLYPEETNGSFRAGLLRAVLTSFASEGVEHARQFLLDGGWGLERELLAAATLAGISFPELQQWMDDKKADVEARKEHRRRLLAPPPGNAKRKFPTIAQLAEPPAPPFVREEKVGRNDPCPCGSDRKYKKCCMAKEQGAPMPKDFEKPACLESRWSFPKEVPTYDPLEHFDPKEMHRLEGAVYDFVAAIEDHEYLAWEAVVCQELGLPLTARQRRELDGLIDFSDDTGEDRVLYINGVPRPSRLWYDALRTIVPHLLLDQFRTADVHYAVVTEGWPRIAAALEQRGADLSLPEGVHEPLGTIPDELRHRLWLQSAFDDLSGLGQEEELTLANEEQRDRIDWFLQKLRGCRQSVEFLGWTPETMLEILILPPKDRPIFARLMWEKLGLPSTKGKIADHL